MSICPTRRRLEHAFSRLKYIQLVRNHRQDPLFEKALEDRIIWRELLELQLQDIDEGLAQIDQLRETAQ